MSFIQGENLDYLKKVRDVIAFEDTGGYGTFIWQEDIFQKRDGIFVPAGRIVLPMNVEGRDPERNFGTRGVAFTAFHKDYFEGITEDSEGFDMSCFCDWFPEMPNPDVFGYNNSVGIQTHLRTKDPYIAVRSHVENMLKNLPKLSELAENAGVQNLVKRVFMEY
jgi:hypothetical protein